jgi:hypothetical protein
MRLKCRKASASVAGDEIFQVLFEVNSEQEDGPYPARRNDDNEPMIQAAWQDQTIHPISVASKPP